MLSLKRFILGIVIFIIGFFINTLELQAEEKDPFVSIIDLEEGIGVIQKVDLSNVLLKGIIYSSAKSVAIINEELVMTGDNWAGYKVERIDKNNITLSDGKKSYQLFLPKDEDAFAKGKRDLVATSQEPLPQEMRPPWEEMYEGGFPMQGDIQRNENEK